MENFEFKRKPPLGQHNAASHSSRQGPAGQGTSLPAAALTGTAPELTGLKGIRHFPTGPRPRVYLSQHSGHGAIISDTGLTLFHGSGGSERSIHYTRGGWPLNESRLGHGGFSADGEHFTLVVETIPGKLLRANTAALLESPLDRQATRYPEFPSVSGRHIFSPAGDFLLSYPGSGLPVCILWRIVEQDGGIRVRAGSTVALPGIPTAEAVPVSSDTVGIGIRNGRDQYGVFLHHLASGKSLVIDHPALVTHLSFSENGQLLWIGDCCGFVSCVELSGELTTSRQRARHALSGEAITALAVTGRGVIVGGETGAIYSAEITAHTAAGALHTLGQTTEGYLCSVSSVDSGGHLLLGFSLGGAMLYQAT